MGWLTDTKVKIHNDDETVTVCTVADFVETGRILDKANGLDKYYSVLALGLLAPQNPQEIEQ